MGFIVSSGALEESHLTVPWDPAAPQIRGDLGASPNGFQERGKASSSPARGGPCAAPSSVQAVKEEMRCA